MSVIYKDGQFYGAQSVKDIFLPVGSIIPMMSNHAPKNTLICDGTVYNIADYLQLANFFESEFGSINYFGGDGVTTFAVPDLKGEFLRGSGTNSHEDGGNGANVGIHQGGSSFTYGQVNNDDSVYFRFVDNTANFVANTDKDLTSSVSGIHDLKLNKDSIVSRTGTQPTRRILRPTNTSVLYCIVYKNIYADVKDLFTAGDGINISEESEISTDNMPSADMSEILSPLPSTISKMTRYSTEEQLVGYWIDGKPLYQRVISGTTSATAGQNKILEELGSSIKIHFINGNVANLIPVNYDSGGSTYYSRCFVASNNLYISVGGYLNMNVTVVIQYTKTTD